MVSIDPQVGPLAAFNAASPEAAERDVLACCESRSFARRIVGDRPYPDPAALQDAVTVAFEALTWDDIVESMNAHPRIGDRVRAGGWSAAEQSGAAAGRDAGRPGAAGGSGRRTRPGGGGSGRGPGAPGGWRARCPRRTGSRPRTRCPARTSR